MNILLIGEQYSPNLGDGVIFSTVEAMIQQDFPDAVIFGVDLSGRVTYSDDTDWLLTGWQSFISKRISADIARSLLVKKQLCILLNNQKIDVIIFVGGQLFMDYFSRSILTIVRQAQKNNIPVIFNSCGFGSNSPSGWKRIRKALNMSNIVGLSLRDEAGLKEILPTRIDVVMAADPVMEISKYWNNYHRSKKTSDIKKVGINIMSPWTTHRINPEVGNAYTKRLLTDLINHLDSMGYEWEIYTNGASEDVAYIRGACREIGIDTQRIAPAPETPQKLVELVTSYDAIIGFRMHTHIIAHSFNIPTVGVIWDEKIRDYATQVGLLDNFLDIDVKSERIIDTFNHTVNQDFQINLPRDRVLSSHFLRQSIEKLA